MLWTARRALCSIHAQAVTWAPVPALKGGSSASLPSAYCSLKPPSLLHAAHAFAIQKPVQPKQDDEPPSSTFIRECKNIISNMEKVNDVVKRILSLETANRKEKSKIRQEQLMNRIAENPEDFRTLEVRIAALTNRIRNYEEHMQKHGKDKAHKRHLPMSINQKKTLLKILRQTNYGVFEKTCKELGVEHTLPPLHFQKVHSSFLAKKALRIRVYQEAQNCRSKEGP